MSSNEFAHSSKPGETASKQKITQLYELAMKEQPMKNVNNT